MEDSGTILIVDDNPNNLQVLMGLLGHAGYKVRPALSGEIALRAMEARKPELILLDVRMPGIDGYETCRRLRLVDEFRDIPVIFISAMQDTEDKLTGFRSGGVDYIAKPFQAEEVLARVRTHVELYRMKQHLERLVQKRTVELASSESRYRVLFEDSPLAVIVYDPENWSILDTNLACVRLLGYSRQEMAGRLPEFAMETGQGNALRALASGLAQTADGPMYTGAIRLQHKDGGLVETQGILQHVEYPQRRAHILMLQDVTESRRAQEKLQREAWEHRLQLERSVHYDTLTGLPNRVLLTQYMHHGIEQCRRTGCSMAVCYLDIDAFQHINEHHGKQVGDLVLNGIASRLRSSMRSGDTLARIGGDEFVLLLQGLASDEDLDAVLCKLQERLVEPLVSDSLSVTLSASIGVTFYPQDDADPDTLLRHADQAMLWAKQSAKGAFRRFDLVGEKRAKGHQEQVQRMRSGLHHNEFVLYYQPKVDLRSNEVVGVEALIRWNHPEKGLLPPGAFLPEIEGDDFMIELGNWVIQEALNQMARWRAQSLHLCISVNAAAQQLASSEFIRHLNELLKPHPHAAGYFELEVLETSALDDIAKIEGLINSCRHLGVGFSLDDFGTGYSSLTYLRQLSADTLKIDQSFIRDMLEDPGDQTIVAGVIGLAAAFGRKVIAEGVESLEHAKILLKMGCTLAQGYGIARPMPAQDIPDWVRSWPKEHWADLA